MMASPISSMQLVGDRHVELPHQVVVEVGRLGEGVLDGRQLGDLGAARAPVVAVVEVVLEELLDVDLLEGVVALLLAPWPPPAAISSADSCSWRHLLQQRVLHHLLLEHLGQLEGGEGQQLDGLLERRREDEPLGEAGAEAQLLLDGQWIAALFGVYDPSHRSRAARRRLVEPEGLAEVDPADLLVGGQLGRAFRTGTPRLP